MSPDGTASPRSSLGYFNNASRGFLLEEPGFKVVEQGAFVEDDFKVSNSLTINAGLRYEILHPPTEENNRLANFDCQIYRLVYAREDGTSRSANKSST